MSELSTRTAPVVDFDSRSVSGKAPFAAFAADIQKHDGLRATIDAAYRAPETERLPKLLEAAALPAATKARAQAVARRLIEGLRARPAAGLVQGLMHEYALSSQEGVALMCLAEALLRIPDSATRDALIADKIGGGEWRAHIGQSPSPFVNAATWGLLVTGRLVGTFDENSLGSALTRLIARSGAPIIRASVDTAMRVMGEQFVCGQTIEAALHAARKLEAQGFRYSYDMLGEAAATAQDAARYLASYTNALHAIGAASAGRGIYEGPGLSIKLSALHPRYQRAQRRARDGGIAAAPEELWRCWRAAMMSASISTRRNPSGSICRSIFSRRYAAILIWPIGTASASSFRPIRSAPRRDRLSHRSCAPDQAPHHGPAWSRAPIGTARSSDRRSRASKTSPFSRAKFIPMFPISPARGCLLAAPGEVYPQFATHNALTLATVHAMAGPNYLRRPI